MKKWKYLLVCIALGILCGACATLGGGPKEWSVQELKELAQGHDLVAAYPDGTVQTYNGRGLSPVLNHLETGDFKRAYMFDKVTGKASALLLAYGGAAKLHTGMLSRQAIAVLNKYGIEYTADKEVDVILNRSRTGLCPMESAVQDIDDAQEAYGVLKIKYQEMIFAMQGD